jgi:hypothetical protein
MKLTRRVMAIAALFALAGPGLAAPLGKVVVEAGDVARQGVPVAVVLPEGTDVREWKNICAVDEQGNRHPAQIETGTPPRLWLIFADRLTAGESRTFTIETTDKEADGVTIADDGKTLVAKIGEREVLAYNQQTMPSPLKDKPQFARSGMLHPVRTPAGKVVTDPMPLPHHTHQHAVMMAWVNTTFEGRHVDFWNSDAKQGRVEHTEVEATTNGPIYGEMVCRLEHIDLTAPEGPKEALREEWRVRIYNVADVNLFDITSTQTCATKSPLILNEYHYGGMAVRGAEEWKVAKKCQLVTSEGLGRRRGNHTRPNWVSLSGELGEGSGGIVVMGSQSNLRHPQPVRLHPDMPYFCFAPVVLGEMRIEPNKPLVSSYRFMTHDGELDRELADSIQKSYVDPPKATFIRHKED